MNRVLLAGAMLGCVSLLGAESGQSQQAATPPDVAHGEVGSPTARERWHNYTRTAFFSPGVFLSSVFPAIGDQRANRPSEDGQGWDAFGMRIARRAAQFEVETALYHSAAAAMRTETEYRPCRCTGTFRRIGYAVSQTFVTRTSSGMTVPNLPLLGGYMSGAMISTQWYPERYRATAEGVRFASLQLSTRTGMNILREFTPDLKRLLKRR